jgi:hypothetical protein
MNKKISPKFFFLLFLLGFLFFCQAKSPESLPELVCCDFEGQSTEEWMPRNPDHWKTTELEDSTVYELTAPGEQSEIRAPASWSLLENFDVTSFQFTGRLKCKADSSNLNRDLCVFFHFQEPTHFYYVHFSAQSDPLHNIIGIVNGKDREKINKEPAGTSVFRLTDKNWHDFKVTYDASSGEIKAYMDDMENPILTAEDKNLTHGLLGIGSFDDTGYFDDICLKGKKSSQ